MDALRRLPGSTLPHLPFVRDRLLRILSVFLTGDRGFEALQRRVHCEPDLLTFDGFPGDLRQLAGASPVVSDAAIYASAAIDWKQFSGQTITLVGAIHPWSNAITPLLPQFTKLTGIGVVTDFQLETAFLGALPIKLAGGSRTPDVFMFLTYGQGISAGWLEPLNAYFSDRSLTDLGWYDESDHLKTAQAFPVWSDGERIETIWGPQRFIRQGTTLLENDRRKRTAALARRARESTRGLFSPLAWFSEVRAEGFRDKLPGRRRPRRLRPCRHQRRPQSTSASAAT